MNLSISEIIAALNKAQQVVGDAPVILKSIEGDVETAAKAIEFSIGIGSDPAGTTVSITHGPANPAPTPAPTGTDGPGNPASEPVQAA